MQDTDVTIQPKRNYKIAKDTNVTIQSKRILKVREILTQESNESEFFKCAGYNRKIYQSLHEKWKTKYWFERIYMYFSNKYQSSKALKFNRQWSKALEIIRQSSKL